jgi:hypothetical protein
MAGIYIALYPTALNNADMDSISDLCSGAKFEELNKRVRKFLIQGLDCREYIDNSATAYILKAKKFSPAIYLLKPAPLYIGHFDRYSLDKIIAMGDHCVSLDHLITEISQSGLWLDKKFEKYFPAKSKLDTSVIKSVLKTLRANLKHARSLQSHCFKDHQVLQ